MARAWAIIGTGGIAAVMAETLRDHPDGETVIAGSRDIERARTFARANDIPNAASYEDAVTHPDVEVVYVATTNDKHCEVALAALEAGKAVLCEKPLGLNAAEVTKMVETSHRHGGFLMEALWMRFLPFLHRVDELIAADAIGEVRHVAAEFGYKATPDGDRRWYNTSLGGGSLLDLGIYPLTLAYHLLGSAESTSGLAALVNGVDTHTVIASDHGGGRFSTLISSFAVNGANEALISGSEGRIRVHGEFHRGLGLTVERGETTDRIDTSYPGSGFQFQVDELHRCLEHGRVESDRHTHADSLALAEWMDEIRKQVGVVYPGDVS